MREKGAVASPGKLQPLPPALDQLHAHAQATAVMAAVMGSADAADRVATRARLHVAAVGAAPDVCSGRVCSGRVCSGALVRRLRRWLWRRWWWQTDNKVGQLAEQLKHNMQSVDKMAELLKKLVGEAEQMA